MNIFFALTAMISWLLIIGRIVSIAYVHSGILSGISFGSFVSEILPIVGSDVLFFSLAYGLAFLLFFVLKKRALGLSLTLFFALWIRHIIDIGVVLFTLNRVTFSESLGFLGTLPSWFNYLIVTIFFLCVGLYVWMYYRIVLTKYFAPSRSIYATVLFLFISSCAYLLSYSMIDENNNLIASQFIKAPIVFDILQSGYKGLGSDPLDTVFPQTYADWYTPISGMAQDPNIIVLFLESFSAVDSKYIGQIDDLIPKTDIIQSQGLAFENFISNGCTSDASHIALLSGIEPWMYEGFGSKSLYDAYVGYTDPLPLFAKKMGYFTSFYSTVSLDFLGQYKFINRVGFDQVIDDATFSDVETYTFGAAPDKYLYNRILDDIDTGTGKKMLIGQTISTHIPFSSPYGNTEDDVYRYADDALRDFYSGLQARKFFDNGLLIIVGDHRKMAPVAKEEIIQWGRSAQGRIVGAIIGTGVSEGMFSSLIQHNDIHYSIKQLIGSGDVLTPPFWSSLWDPSIQRSAAVRYCGYLERDYVVTYSDDSKNNNSIMDKLYAYINAFELFQQGGTTGSASTSTGVSFIVDQALGSEPAYHGLDGITLIGHGGLPSTEPYNSIAGFVRAMYAGADGVELDVSFTKDNMPIVAHGPGLRSPECREIPIDTLSWDYIQKNCFLSNGEHFQDLRSVLEQTKDIVPLYIVELKFVLGQDTVALTKKLLATLEELSVLDKVFFISYDDKAREYLANYTTLGVGWDTFDPSDLGLFAKKLPYDRYSYFMLPHDRWTKDMIEQAKSLGINIMTYTPKTDEELIAAYTLGLRSFIVDDVQWAKEVLEEIHDK